MILDVILDCTTPFNGVVLRVVSKSDTFTQYNSISGRCLCGPRTEGGTCTISTTIPGIIYLFEVYVWRNIHMHWMAGWTGVRLATGYPSKSSKNRGNRCAPVHFRAQYVANMRGVIFRSFPGTEVNRFHGVAKSFVLCNGAKIESTALLPLLCFINLRT